MMPTRELVPITGWTNRRLQLKERMKAIKELDHRMTESRIVEEAVLEYLPRLEYKLQAPPTQFVPAMPRKAGR